MKQDQDTDLIFVHKYPVFFHCTMFIIYEKTFILSVRIPNTAKQELYDNMNSYININCVKMNKIALHAVHLFLSFSITLFICMFSSLSSRLQQWQHRISC